jgi:DNA polymerase-1
MVYRDYDISIPGLGFVPLAKTETAKSTEARRYYKVDKDTLPFLRTNTKVQKAVIKLLLKQSKLAKIVSTFWNSEKGTGLMSKVGVDGRLHTNYNQTITATGRLSSSDPNSQNLPRSGTSPIKKCIIPRFDGIENADLSQIEWRVPAQLSGCPVMFKEISSGVDQHSAACTKLMKLPLNKLNRFYAKTFNFRMIYGGTEYGFHKDPHMPALGLKKWGQVVKDFFTKYHGLKSWHDKIIKHVINGDGTYVLPTGRKFKYYLMDNGKYNERTIKNYPIQGMAGGDILPLCAVIIWREMKKRGMKSIPILTVHDSIVFDVIESEKIELADLCMYVFTHLPQYIKLYWGYNWVVPLTGEVEYGPDYGTQERIR